MTSTSIITRTQNWFSTLVFGSAAFIFHWDRNLYWALGRSSSVLRHSIHPADVIGSLYHQPRTRGILHETSLAIGAFEYIAVAWDHLYSYNNHISDDLAF